MSFIPEPLSHDQAVEYGRRGAAKRSENRAKRDEMSYPERELSRVRVQIELLNKAIDDELGRKDPDMGKVDKAARAMNVLSERELAGRPKAGTYRPNRPPAPDRPKAEPLE